MKVGSGRRLRIKGRDAPFGHRLSQGRMDRAEEFGARAVEAERLARNAPTERERDAYQRVALGWRDLEAAARSEENRRV